LQIRPSKREVSEDRVVSKFFAKAENGFCCAVVRRLPVRALGVLMLAACSRSPAAPASVQSSAVVSRTPHVASSSSSAVESGVRSLARDAVTFFGMCDASAAVEITERIFAVADDEDSVIRTYDAMQGGAPLSAVDLSPSLDLPMKGKKKPRPAETDLEAATRIGDRAYWITSHGRTSNGKLAPERLRFFATTLPKDGTPIAVVGRAYEELVDDLLAEPRLERFELARAIELAPKAPGGFNLEGMTARAGGGVWLGLRNPVPEGKALLVPLLNPDELVRGGARAAFGDPLLLDLGGLGVRSLSSWQNRYLIAAGSAGDGGTSRLFTWNGQAQLDGVPGIDLRDFNPEGFFTPDGSERMFVLSDDGTVTIDGKPCKSLDDPARKRFRGAWLSTADLR
jgi:hypothetical protein